MKPSTSQRGNWSPVTGFNTVCQLVNCLAGKTGSGERTRVHLDQDCLAVPSSCLLFSLKITLLGNPTPSFQLHRRLHIHRN